MVSLYHLAFPTPIVLANSSDKYCEVLKSVEKYIHGRWDPWREVVKNETKSLVTEVCEVYTISEKSLGDIVDRKMSQVPARARTPP